MGHEGLFCTFFSVYSCHLFLIFSASVRSIPFLSFIEPIFAWNVPWISLIFLKRSLVFPILLFFSIFLHWSLKKAFLSLLAILWNSAFRWLYLSFSHLLFASLLFTAICKASQTAILLFCNFFPWEWSWPLFPAQCYEPQMTDVVFCHILSYHLLVSLLIFFFTSSCYYNYYLISSLQSLFNRNTMTFF